MRDINNRGNCMCGGGWIYGTLFNYFLDLTITILKIPLIIKNN